MKTKKSSPRAKKRDEIIDMKIREERAAGQADNLSVSVNRMQMIARITNGIEIQLGLSDGSISPDALLAELLRIDSKTLGQLMTLKEEEVRKAMKSLADLPKSLTDSDAVKNNEAYFLEMEEMRKTVGGLGDFEKWNGTDEIKKELTDLKSKNLKLDYFINVFSSVEKLLPHIPAFSISYDSSQFGSNKGSIGLMNGECGNLVKAGTKANGTIYTEVDNVINLQKSLSEVFLNLDIIEKTINRKSTRGGDDENVKNIEKIFNVAKGTKNLSAGLKSMFSLIQNDGGSNNKITFTFGFPDGLSDFSHLPNDFADRWVSEVLNSPLLKKEIEGLLKYGPSLKTVDNSLKQLKTKSFDMFDDVNALPLTSDLAKKSLKDEMDCDKKFAGVSDLSSIKNLRSDAKKFDETKEKLRQKMTEVVDMLKDGENVEIFKALAKMADVDTRDEKAVEDGFEKINKYEKWEKFVNLTKLLDGLLKEIQKLKDDILNSILNIQSELKDVESFKDTVKTHKAGLDCLKKQTNGEQVGRIILLSQKLRNSKSSLDQKIVDDLVSIVMELKKLHNSKGGGRNKRSSNSLLNSFPTKKNHTMIFGRATRGISHMKTAIEKEYAIKSINQKLSVLEKEMKTVKLDPADEKILKSLVNLKGSVDVMYGSLEKWKTGLKDPSSTTLSEHFPIYKTSESVTGAELDFRKLSESISKLKVKVKDPASIKSLDELSKDVEFVNPLDLDFASYKTSVKEIDSALREFDKFFVQFNQNTVPSSTPMTIAKNDSSTMYWAVPVGIVGIAAIVGGSIFGYFYLKKKKKGKETKALVKPTPEASEKSSIKVKSSIIELALAKTQSEDEIIVVLVVKKESIDNFFFFLSRTVSWIKNKKELETFSKAFQTFIEETFESVRNEPLAVDAEKGHENESRYKTGVVMKTRYQFVQWSGTQGDFIHANYVSFPNGLKFILTQGPLAGGKEGVSTIEKFWWMAWEQFTPQIVMLCKLQEDGKEKCAKYYPEDVDEVLKFDKLTVKCIEKKEEEDGALIIRKLLVKFDKWSELETEHLQYTAWPDQGAPSSPKVVLEMLDRVKTNNKPVIVHCTDGVGRSGVFAGIELGYQILAKEEDLNLKSLMIHLRSLRSQAIQEPIQLAFLVYALAEYLVKGTKEHAKDLGYIKKYYAGWKKTDKRAKAGSEMEAISGEVEEEDDGLVPKDVRFSLPVFPGYKLEFYYSYYGRK